MYSLSDSPILTLEETLRLERPSRTIYEEKGLRFDFFFYPKGKKKLLIFFPSALPKNKRIVPSFHRWSWCENFDDHDCLCVSDPTLHLDSEILGGWMQGSRDSWALEIFLTQLDFICNKKGYESVIFTGSSLGGFCAIQASFLFKKPNVRTLFYAENPQISLFNYIYKNHANKLAKVSFGENSIDHLNRFDFRLDVVKTGIKYGLNSKGMVVIKESDEHHFSVHVAYLKQNFPDVEVEVISKELDPTGHTPLLFEQMKTRVKKIEEEFK